MSILRMTAGLGACEIAGPLLIIVGDLREKPMPSLQEAIQPLIDQDVIPNLQLLARSIYSQVQEAKQDGGSFKGDPLSVDCITALMLYSAEDLEPPLYKDMNSKCYFKNRNSVRPYSKFLWLFHHALKMMPPYTGRVLYRGVKMDLKDNYPKGRKVIWHGPSSCTTDIDVLTCDQFLGTTGVGTIFVIELTQHQAREITRYSLIPDEHEVMLPAGSKFEVLSQLPRGDLTIITLKEVQSDDIFMDLQPAHATCVDPVPGESHLSGSSSAGAASTPVPPPHTTEPKTQKTTPKNLVQQYYHAKQSGDHDTMKATEKLLCDGRPWMRELLGGATELDVTFDHLGAQGAEQMAAALRENRTLTSLAMTDNSIGDQGAEQMAAALRENRTLTSLAMTDNSIGDQGAEHMAAALRENRTLTSLDMGHNSIGDQGAEHMAAALR
ncbi:unnamed protein product, partial [Polarella glacialis]